MAPSDGIDEHATARARSILPLPEDVVAQIKASTAIVALGGVVLELLKNALDARATRVEATVDFARGACTVEDDGLGISPLDFRADGGLGKMHCTSKYYSHETLFGRNGTFLASLAAMSLLTVASRHHEHRSHSSITFHHSKVLERQLPASANQQVHGKHGTRVTVRNLFGNIPVRVKQRSLVLEQKAEHARLWDRLKRDVAGLLLSWRGSLSLKVRDGDNGTMLIFNTSNPAEAAKDIHQVSVKLRSTALSSILNVLTQANYIAVDEWASWVPASASSSALSIRGAISLHPAPSKHAQFISLGIRPLLAKSGHNELYDEVNRLFALSNFSTIEEDADVDHLEKTRRQTDKRFKNDVYVNRQLKARKHVDRHPMFYLRITVNGDHGARVSEDRLLNGETTLQAVVDILSAMITQWLSVHHFRPRKAHKNRNRLGTASSARSESTEGDTASTLGSSAVSTTREADRNALQSAMSKSSSTTVVTRKRKRLPTTSSNQWSKKLQHRAFAEWSRIKSGKADFFTSLPSLPKLTQGGNLPDGQRLDMTTFRHAETDAFANFDIEPVPQGALSLITAPEESSEPANQYRAGDDKHDESILWADPSTNKTHLLNARTGCVILSVGAEPHTGSITPKFAVTQNAMHKSLRLAPKSATTAVGKTPWLDDVLQSWDNPVFKPSEKQIQQASIEEDDFDHGHQQRSHHPSSHIDTDKAFKELSATSSRRLSKEGLRCAQVIAQVDKKFILVKMRTGLSVALAEEANDQLLVLIDQHAADERVQVETLLKDLCTPLAHDTTHLGYQSKLGHRAQVASVILEKSLQFTVSSQEQAHFITHAAQFAAWGVLYDLQPSSPSTNRIRTSGRDQCRLSATSLPPAISERCKADPQLLISFLRSTVWRYADDPLLSRLPTRPSTAKPSDWVRRLATCPPGLIDLINSRACRSAIMFNDDLSQEECEALVKKLADCVFPFMCAHGRPSMVPLIDLGRVGARGRERKGEEEGFVQAWKKWKVEA